MKEIKLVKDSLRIINSKYVSSKKIDEISYEIKFTYKNRNYIINLNTNYKFIMLIISESIYGMNINNDTLELIDYIKQMIMFTGFENYNIFAVSCREEIRNNESHKILEITQEKDNKDIVIGMEVVEDKRVSCEFKTIEYSFGLNWFDKRLFDEDIFEDFDEKVSTLCEEDLFLMYTTFISYFYKLINNLWNDEKVDPYVINNIINTLYDEIQRRLNEKSYYEWFNEWNSYFNEDVIDNYLNHRNNDNCKSK